MFEGRARRLCQLRYERDLALAAIGKAVGMTANSVAEAEAESAKPKENLDYNGSP